MKIPKYIDYALKARTAAAFRFNKYDYIISRWLTDKNLIDDIDTACTFGGVESIVNPESAEQEIREAIINAEEDK